MTKISSFRIENSVALVTGTNKPNGIGSHLVRALLEQGAKKVYATARDVSQLDYLVQEFHDKVVPVSLDVTDVAALQALPTQFPDVTLVVNNAGYFSGEDGKLDDVTNEIKVNYVAPLVLVQSFAPLLKAAAAKSEETNVDDDDTKIATTAVINVNSIASFINFPIGGTYSASKAAAHSLTQAQRRELPESLVVGVYPGPIDTDMAKSVDMAKTSPRDVALEVIKALENGIEDLFPDPTSSQMIEGWKQDAKAMEQQMANFPLVTASQ